MSSNREIGKARRRMSDLKRHLIPLAPKKAPRVTVATSTSDGVRVYTEPYQLLGHSEMHTVNIEPSLLELAYSCIQSQIEPLTGLEFIAHAFPPLRTLYRHLSEKGEETKEQSDFFSGLIATITKRQFASSRLKHRVSFIEPQKLFWVLLKQWFPETQNHSHTYGVVYPYLMYAQHCASTYAWNKHPLHLLTIDQNKTTVDSVLAQTPKARNWYTPLLINNHCLNSKYLCLWASWLRNATESGGAWYCSMLDFNEALGAPHLRVWTRIGNTSISWNVASMFDNSVTFYPIETDLHIETDVHRLETERRGKDRNLSTTIGSLSYREYASCLKATTYVSFDTFQSTVALFGWKVQRTFLVSDYLHLFDLSHFGIDEIDSLRWLRIVKLVQE